MWSADIRSHRAGSLLTGAALVLASTVPILAQSSYRDDTARALHAAAMDERERFDDSVVQYTAVVRQRIGVALRMPLKDRTLYRSEAAHRVWWTRDGEDLVQVLALRQQAGAGMSVDFEDDLDRFDASFDPMNDRLFFGFAENDEDMGEADGSDFWFEHPLYEEWTESYWFSTGDTIAINLPDGRRIEAVELQVVPREATVHRMTGSLWIEPGTGSLVRAVYRLSDQFDAIRDVPDLREEARDGEFDMVPGLLKPWTADITMISVDYALWDFSVWMPRSMRVDGVVSAGIFHAPITMDYSYEMESVTTEASLELGEPETLPEVHFRTRSEAMAYLNELAFGSEVPYAVRLGRDSDDTPTRFIYPEEPGFLQDSPHLPPPVWDEAPGFASESELREQFDALASLPGVTAPQVPATFRWGIQRPDLVRYNRVEALSIGMRGQIRPRTFLGPLSMTGTLRLGLADLEPNARGDIARETLRRRVQLSVYNELASVDEGARHLGLGNSLTGLLFGRDDGDYYRRSGATLELTPPSARRRSFRLRGYAEYQRPADVDTDFALFKMFSEGWSYRPNILAAEGWDYGATVEVNPWWGTDPRLAQGGLDILLHGGMLDSEYARSSVTGRLVLPLPGDLRFAAEAGAGTSWGALPVQRLWYVGGPRTLRGYGPLSAVGTSFARGRAELARTYDFGSLSLFSDWGWAGERASFDASDGLYSIGAGLSLLDGLIRMDGAYGLRAPRDFRLDFYLDAIL